MFWFSPQTTMEAIIQDLNIPKRQIRETGCPNRFQLLAHKSWLKLISQSGKVSSDFPLYKTEAFEWPHGGPSSAWSRVYVSVSIVNRFGFIFSSPSVWFGNRAWFRNMGCVVMLDSFSITLRCNVFILMMLIDRVGVTERAWVYVFVQDCCVLIKDHTHTRWARSMLFDFNDCTNTNLICFDIAIVDWRGRMHNLKMHEWMVACVLVHLTDFCRIY